MTLPVKARADIAKHVTFDEELQHRSFEFEQWEVEKEYTVKMRSWSTMEKANDVPVLKISRAAGKAMNHERCSEILQKARRGHRIPVIEGELPEQPTIGILRRSPGDLAPEVMGKDKAVVHDNLDDDMTWNLLAHLRHYRKRNNS